MQYLLDLRAKVRSQLSATEPVQAVFEGRLNRGIYARYLTNVWHYAIHSAVVIGMAGARCVPGNPMLGDYLLPHAREEYPGYRNGIKCLVWQRCHQPQNGQERNPCKDIIRQAIPTFSKKAKPLTGTRFGGQRCC